MGDAAVLRVFCKPFPGKEQAKVNK
jgi:hypothetical protein